MRSFVFSRTESNGVYATDLNSFRALGDRRSKGVYITGRVLRQDWDT